MELDADRKLLTPNQKLFGSTWLGKHPVTLLQEYTRKQRWSAPDFTYIERNGQFQCRVMLARKPASSVSMFFNAYYADKLEARHVAATYTLHRLGVVTSLKLLPPAFKILWARLESLKIDMDPQQAAIEYNGDPFRPQFSSGTLSTKQSKPWLSYPQIYVPKELRERLESVIRSNLDTAVSGTFDKSVDTTQLRATLIQKGFRETHADECLQYRSTLAECLDWLCIHLPEDDLPSSMKPSDKKSIVISQTTSVNDLARQYALERLGIGGFSKVDCIAALEGRDEFTALVYLCHRLGSIERLEIELVDLGDELEDEKEVLESIYSDLVIEESELGTRYCVQIGPISVSICIPTLSDYPFEVPGISLDAALPSYIRLSILQRVLEECKAFVGSPMIFSLLGSIESHLDSVIDNPPLLLSLHPVQKAIALSTLNVSGPIPSRGKKKPSNAPSKTLKEDFMRLQQDVSYKRMLDVRMNLPSYKFKNQIVDHLKSSKRLIISGDTGCGKSTQTGQFLYQFD